MPTREDIGALANLIRYSEDEAARLGLNEVVIYCLRIIAMEMTNATADKKTKSGGMVPEKGD